MKKKSIKLAPVFRPVEICVVGTDRRGFQHKMMIVRPGVEYDGMGRCVVYVHKD